MAKDIKIIYDSETQSGDFQQNNGDLILDESFETAILISLFTDRRATNEEAEDPNDKRGWWGDQLSNIPGDQIGSKLWLLSRAKNTQQNIVLAREYVYEALEWLIEDGVCTYIDVQTEAEKRSNGDVLKIKVTLYKQRGGSIVYKYEVLWENL